MLKLGKPEFSGWSKFKNRFFDQVHAVRTKGARAPNNPVDLVPLFQQ